MKWTYSIKNKMAASMALLGLCLLVLLSHYLDRLHTRHVKDSISTLYEDRLIAENYILKMTQDIYQIREALKGNEDHDLKSNTIRKITADFKTTYHQYIKTRLTKTEKTTALALIRYVKEFEQAMVIDKDVTSIQTDKILASLNKLSTIQLDESKLIMKQVESQYAALKTSSQFAFAIIIIILVVLQIMVFSGESLIPLFKPKDPRLN